MLTRKCDICGAEMRMTTPRYKVTFDGWLYTEEIDICMDCFKWIAEEIKQADTPQTEMTTEQVVNELLSLKKILDDGKMPKQRCGNCKHLTY